MSPEVSGIVAFVFLWLSIWIGSKFYAFHDRYFSGQGEPYDTEACCVYLMYDPKHHLYKIGISNNPSRRRKELEGQIGNHIQILKTIRLPSRRQAETREQTLHNRYDSKWQLHPVYHEGRTEWFRNLTETALTN